MTPLLLLVFLLQLAIYLINTIGATVINDLLWQVFNSYLPSSVMSSSAKVKEQVRLRREVVRIKREMKAISAQDDFARWARVRREHDKVLGSYDRVSAELSAQRSSFDSKANIVRWTCTTGLRFALQFWHAKTPVYTYPRGWFPWPVEWILGFPRCPYGGVSINVWSAVCGIVIALVGDLVGSLSQTPQATKETVTGAEKEKMKS